MSNIAGPRPPSVSTISGVGCPAYRLLGSRGVGEFGRIAVVDADLKHLRFGVEDRAQAGDAFIGGKKPPALGPDSAKTVRRSAWGTTRAGGSGAGRRILHGANSRNR